MKQFTFSIVVLIFSVIAVDAGTKIQQLKIDSTLPGRPVSLASGDLNEDGVPDLVIGYAQIGHGSLAILLGNQQALLSHDTHIDPFLPGARTIETPQSPDFIGVGDFNADSHLDIVVAQKGANTLYWIPGNGKATSNKIIQTKLNGNIDHLFTADMNRKD